jgi:hypothetical protein
MDFFKGSFSRLSPVESKPRLNRAYFLYPKIDNLPGDYFLPVADLAPVAALAGAVLPVAALAGAVLPVAALAPVEALAVPCALTPRVIVAAIKSIATVLMVFMFFFCFLIVN